MKIKIFLALAAIVFCGAFAQNRIGNDFVKESSFEKDIVCLQDKLSYEDIDYLQPQYSFDENDACFQEQKSQIEENDVRIEFCFGQKSYVYQLSKQKIQQFVSEESLKIRGFYQGKEEKLLAINTALGLGFEKDVALEYVLFGISNTIEKVSKAVYLPVVDATAKFHPFAKPTFTYTKEEIGRNLDKEHLYAQVLKNMEASNDFSITVKTFAVQPLVTKQELVKNTVEKATFTTYCNTSSAERQQNIQLSLKRLNGSVIAPNDILSFNKKVGKRTADNGFFVAKIIDDGVYTDGVGGGVCQASTTLFNACLLANLTAKELYQHTLVSGYIEPSFDAMVSANADLKILNNTENNVYIAARCVDGVATVKVYGEPNKYKIVRRSEVTERVQAEVKIEKSQEYYDGEEHWLTKPVDKIKSCGYLEYYKNNKLVEVKKIRTNTYKAVEGVKVVGTKPRPQPQEQQEPNLISQPKQQLHEKIN